VIGALLSRFAPEGIRSSIARDNRNDSPRRGPMIGNLRNYVSRLWPLQRDTLVYIRDAVLRKLTLRHACAVKKLSQALGRAPTQLRFDAVAGLYQACWHPFCPEIPGTREYGALKGVRSVEWAAQGWDATVVVTDHAGVDYEAVATRMPLVIDTRNVYPAERRESSRPIFQA